MFYTKAVTWENAQCGQYIPGDELQEGRTYEVWCSGYQTLGGRVD